MTRASWARRHAMLLVACAALGALAIDGGYQIYAARIAHRNAVAVTLTHKTAAKVNRIAPAVCAQTRLLFTVFNALVEDTGPSFGSPPDGPIVPGARAKLIGRLSAYEAATSATLRKQGCKVDVS